MHANAEYDLVGTDEFRHFRDEMMQRYSIAEQERVRGEKIMRLPELIGVAPTGGLLSLPLNNTLIAGPESGFVWRVGRVVVSSSGSDNAQAVTTTSGVQNSGQATSPSALQTITSVTVGRAGLYSIPWNIELGGTLGSQDRDNLALLVNGVSVATSINGINSGTVYPQETEQLELPQGATVAIQTIGAGTVASVYQASLEANLTTGAGSPVALYVSSDGSTQQRNLVDSTLQTGQAYYPSSRGLYLMPGEQLAATIQGVAGNIYMLTGQVVSVPAEMQGKLT
jgi:hypothetical protein